MLIELFSGKTIECVSLIGLAVGPEKFMSDASEIMDMLLKTHGEGCELPDDDPQTSYLISAWSRLCKVRLSNRKRLSRALLRNYLLLLSGVRKTVRTVFAAGHGTGTSYGKYETRSGAFG